MLNECKVVLFKRVLKELVLACLASVNVVGILGSVCFHDGYVFTLRLDWYSAVLGTRGFSPSHHSHSNSHLNSWTCRMEARNSRLCGSTSDSTSPEHSRWTSSGKADGVLRNVCVN